MSNNPHNPSGEPEGPRPSSNEDFSVNWRSILIAGAGLLLLALFVNALAGVIALFFPPQGSPADVRQLPPTPQLQVSPRQDLQALQATEQANLSGYAWVNQQAGVVRIPIEQAMALVAQGATPVVGGSPPAAATSVAGGGAAGSPQGAGAQIFQDLGCSGCHQAASSPLAPTLHGLFGSTVQLSDGSTVTADEDYLRESILQPQAKIVAGFQPIMPSFSGRVDDQQMAALIEYIKSLQP